jgi:ABC-2 type transport system ATP-binding protein
VIGESDRAAADGRRQLDDRFRRLRPVRAGGVSVEVDHGAERTVAWPWGPLREAVVGVPTRLWKDQEVARMGAVAVRIEGLSKYYGKVRALEDLHLDVAEGEVVGYLGPNGAGKTTTIRLLLGLIRPSAGRAEIFGLDCQHQVVEAHRQLAYVAGEASLWPSLTGAETLRLLGRVQGRVDDTYRDELIARFDLDPSKKVRAYSKGNRQKLILVAALMTRARLLVLDEPTSGLDPLMEQAFRQCVHEARDRGQTIFLSSHILSEVEALCDRVGILRAGLLVEMGTLAEMRHLSALTVEATFEAAVPDLSGVPGVSAIEVVGQLARCQVRGSIEPLLKVLASSGVRELLSREPSLEEIFLAQYGSSGQEPERGSGQLGRSEDRAG